MQRGERQEGKREKDAVGGRWTGGGQHSDNVGHSGNLNVGPIEVVSCDVEYDPMVEVIRFQSGFVTDERR